MMKYRLATINDQSSLNHISLVSKKYWAYPEEWIQKWTEDLKLTESDIEKFDILIAEFEQEIIGFCAILNEKSHYEIVHLWLLPQYIGKGFGKKLLPQALLRFTKNDKPILVTADPNAEQFYKKQGFKKINEVESYPKGRFLPVMKKES